MNIKSKIVASSPIICLIIFLLLGFCFGLWHPGWMVFFLIPILPIILYNKKIIVTYPTICTIIYLVMGFVFGLWHPGWIIFLTIPVVSIFTSGNKKIAIEIDEDTDEDEE